MKKILILFLCGILILGVTGCSDKKESTENKSAVKNDTKVNNEESNEMSLKCSGDYILTFGLMVGTRSQVSGGEIEDSEIYSYTFDDANNYGKGVYKFIFDENKLVKIESIETFNSSYSNQITDTDLQNPDNAIEGCNFYRNKSGNVVFDCAFDTNNDNNIVKAFNTNAKTPDKLKEVLEKHTSLVCN